MPPNSHRRPNTSPVRASFYAELFGENIPRDTESALYHLDSGEATCYRVLGQMYQLTNKYKKVPHKHVFYVFYVDPLKQNIFNSCDPILF